MYNFFFFLDKLGPPSHTSRAASDSYKPSSSHARPNS